MKKLLSVLISLISIICLAFAFGGCDNETAEVKGQFYTMEEAYENHWLDEGDLKSIACCYYENDLRYEENPYSGMFTSTVELSEKMETDIKQAFLEQVVRLSEEYKDDVSIKRYFGTYNGNIVVRMYCEGVCIDHYIEPEAEVGGVIFKEYWEGDFRVYRIN